MECFSQVAVVLEELLKMHVQGICETTVLVLVGRNFGEQVPLLAFETLAPFLRRQLYGVAIIISSIIHPSIIIAIA